MKKDIQIIRNGYKDKNCVIFGCGPSLNDFSDNDIQKICKNNIVFCIKQAFHRVPKCNFHFLNDNNYELYKYETSNASIVVECPSNNRVHYLESIADYFFIVEQNWDISQALSRTLDFDAWTIDQSPLLRPFGPGLMFETVLFFAHYIGCPLIYTIGWDGGPSGSTTRNHFYGERQLVNPANALYAEESEYEIECSKHFYLWLKNNGVDLKILSNNSHMHEIIPRVAFKDIDWDN